MLIERFGEKLDWDGVVEHAIRRGWQRGVYLSLRFAEEFMGIHMSAIVFEKLKPGDDDVSLIYEVRQQLFSDENTASAIHKPISLTANRGFTGIVQITLQRIFIPKSELANEYLVSPDSIWIYFYFPVRAINLILRHSKSLWNIHIRKSEADAAKQKGRIVSWLEGE